MFLDAMTARDNKPPTGGRKDILVEIQGVDRGEEGRGAPENTICHESTSCDSLTASACESSTLLLVCEFEFAIAAVKWGCGGGCTTGS